MKRSAFVLFATAIVVFAVERSTAKPKPKIDIGTVRVADAKGDQLTLDQNAGRK